MRDTILRVLEVFEQVDVSTAAFAQESAIRCPDGCGKCCEKPFSINASPAEFAPVAEALIQNGLAEATLERAQQDTTGVCVFYQPHPDGQGKGRCGIYQNRPLVCRLFGFSAVRDKHKHTTLAACAVHRQTQPDVVARAEEQTSAGVFKPLIFSEAASVVLQADFGYPPYPIPINDALAIALQDALWRVALAGLSREDTEQI